MFIVCFFNSRRVAAYEAKKETSGRKNKAATSSSSGLDVKKYKGLSEADRNLAERLDRLKEDRKKMRGKIGRAIKRSYIFSLSFINKVLKYKFKSGG